LSDYIIDHHHSYVRKAVPQILSHLEKVVIKHGNKYPSLKVIKSIFDSVAEELFQHIMKEEKLLFHIVRYLEDCKRFDERPRLQGFKTIKIPIESMEAEHSNAGNAMEKIRNLTKNYTPPADACSTFKLTYKELEDFEKDLHIHVHLENNILFPKAIELEQELLNK
jgi:regulator of cell morphogenesis and NO signaling